MFIAHAKPAAAPYTNAASGRLDNDRFLLSPSCPGAATTNDGEANPRRAPALRHLQPHQRSTLQQRVPSYHRPSETFKGGERNEYSNAAYASGSQQSFLQQGASQHHFDASRFASASLHRPENSIQPTMSSQVSNIRVRGMRPPADGSRLDVEKGGGGEASMPMMWSVPDHELSQYPQSQHGAAGALPRSLTASNTSLRIPKPKQGGGRVPHAYEAHKADDPPPPTRWRARPSPYAPAKVVAPAEAAADRPRAWHPLVGGGEQPRHAAQPQIPAEHERLIAQCGAAAPPRNRHEVRNDRFPVNGTEQSAVEYPAARKSMSISLGDERRPSLRGDSLRRGASSAAAADTSEETQGAGDRYLLTKARTFAQQSVVADSDPKPQARSGEIQRLHQTETRANPPREIASGRPKHEEWSVSAIQAAVAFKNPVTELEVDPRALLLDDTAINVGAAGDTVNDGTGKECAASVPPERHEPHATLPQKDSSVASSVAKCEKTEHNASVVTPPVVEDAPSMGWTVKALKHYASSRSLSFPSKIHKKDLLALITASTEAEQKAKEKKKKAKIATTAAASVSDSSTKTKSANATVQAAKVTSTISVGSKKGQSNQDAPKPVCAAKKREKNAPKRTKRPEPKAQRRETMAQRTQAVLDYFDDCSTPLLVRRDAASPSSPDDSEPTPTKGDESSPDQQHRVISHNHGDHHVQDEQPRVEEASQAFDFDSTRPLPPQVPHGQESERTPEKVEACGSDRSTTAEESAGPAVRIAGVHEPIWHESATTECMSMSGSLAVHLASGTPPVQHRPPVLAETHSARPPSRRVSSAEKDADNGAPSRLPPVRAREAERAKPSVVSDALNGVAATRLPHRRAKRTRSPSTMDQPRPSSDHRQAELGVGLHPPTRGVTVKIERSADETTTNGHQLLSTRCSKCGQEPHASSNATVMSELQALRAVVEGMAKQQAALHRIVMDLSKG